MDLRNPPVAGGVQRRQRVAVSLFQRVVPQHMVGRKVPIPDGVVGRLRGQSIALPGFFDGAAAVCSGVDASIFKRCAQTHDLRFQFFSCQVFQSASRSHMSCLVWGRRVSAIGVMQ
ncbi:hypothetical protein BUE60_00920 [Pseudomonas syringae pv. actinidiae]|nr:hypothetical protein BUE61_04410 [Pseudomonas syringae pv. actinidiae]PBK57421.1 hypothetical protein BUE60_00920 [Pseudomonas syringae pv. actinidiae]